MVRAFRLSFALLLSLAALAPGSEALGQIPGLPSPPPAAKGSGAAVAADASSDASPATSVEELVTGMKDYRFDPNDRSTPRRAMVGYIGACRMGEFDRAANFLDLSQIPEDQRTEQGPVLARHFKFVLDRYIWVDPEKLSDDPTGDDEDGLGHGIDDIGSIPLQGSEVRVLLRRSKVDGDRVWQIARSTVAVIPELYEEHGYPWLDRIIPGFLLTTRVGNSALWQWLGLLPIPFLAWYVAGVIRFALKKPLERLVSLSKTRFDNLVLEAIGPPFRLLVAVFLFRLGIKYLYLSVLTESRLEFISGLILWSAIVWFLLRLINIFSSDAQQRFQMEGNRGMLSLLPMVQKTLQVLVIALAVTVFAQSMGVNLTAVLAGAGVAGVAVAFAAQKTIENLFGGVSVLLDQPVRVGDFCKVGSNTGTVEEIGLRSTRIRSVDRTLISIPNAQFSTDTLENYGARDRIRLYQVIGVRYETSPDQLRWILAETRKLIFSHPMIGPDGARVRFINFGASSLDFEIFCYVNTTDFATFVTVREDVFLRLMDIVEASGSGFAFPSQTLYLGRDTGLDAERTKAAESAVQGWRERNQLPFPNNTPDQIESVAGTLDYPPKGSVDAVKGT